jgi:hypothetical protein
MRSPAPRYPTLRNVQDGLAGFLGPGASRERGRRAPCRSPKATSPAWARLPGRRGGRTDLRRAWFPVPSPIGHGLGLFQSNREANA